MVIALVLCANAPRDVGAKLWDELPTLRALIKMMTAEKYRFPTVDCDDLEREEMKRNENELRVKVSFPLPFGGALFPMCYS